MTKQKKSKKKNDIERLQEKLKTLINVGKECSKIKPETHYEAHTWTAIKLISLLCYVDVYSRIMFKQKRNLNLSEIIYIDPLAGSGTNRIRETGDIIAGSPLISGVFSSFKFDKYFFAEENYDKRIALQARLENLLKDEGKRKRVIIEDDCNKLLKRVMNYLSSLNNKAHYLLFIDSEGIETNWKELSEVLYYPGDLVFVFQIREVIEQINRWKNYSAVTKFFGNEKWKECRNERELLDLYKAQIKGIKTTWGKGREVIDDLTIKSSEKDPSPYYYNMIFAALRTKGENPWFKNLLPYLKEKVARYSGNSVKQALDVLTGRSTRIDWFLPSRGSTLDNFF
ncbi:MAG: three-Cys-motif partner protein TcmP [Candidatus Bathyarchaeia archaeon]